MEHSLAGNIRRDVPSYELDLNDPIDLVSFIQRAEEASAEILLPWRRRAYRNLQFAAGNHEIDWGTGRADPRWDEDAPIPSIYTNWIRLYLKMFIARVIESPTTWKTSPTPSSDISDAAASRTLGQLLRYTWERLKIDDSDNLPGAMRMLGCTGIVFALPGWEFQEETEEIVKASEIDSKIKAYLRSHPDYEPSQQTEVLNEILMAEHGVGLEGFEVDDDGNFVIHKGGPSLEWFNGFSVTEDLGAGRFQDGRFCVVRSTMSVAEARETWPKHADDIEHEVIDPYGMPSENSSTQDKGSGAEKASFDSVVVHSFFHRRTDKYKEGIFAQVVSKRLVRQDVSPYTEDGIPLVRIIESPETDQPRPTCTCDDIIVINAAVNTIDRQIISHINKTVDAGWFFYENSVNEDFVDTVSSESATPVTPGQGFPEPKPVQPIASHVLIQRQNLIQSMKELGGFTDPAIGQPNSRIQSGKALEIAKEGADSLSLISMRFVEIGLAQIGRKFLPLWNDNESKDRMIRITGSDGEQDVLSMKGMTFMAQAENKGAAAIHLWDVEVEIAPKLTFEAVMNAIDRYIERGLLIPERDRAIIVRAISERRMPDIDVTRRHRENAHEENEILRQMSDALSSGDVQPDQVLQTLANLVSRRPGDNDAAHLSQHYELTGSQDWRKMHVLVRDYAVKHIVEHQEVLGAAMQQPQSGADSKKPTTGGNTNARAA